MTETSSDTLTACMRAMAAGDNAAVFTFVNCFGDDVERTVRAVLKSMGRSEFARDKAELNGLVFDACCELQARAKAWQPGGAAPWVWANNAIRAVVARAVGHRTADVDILDREVSRASRAVDLTADHIHERHGNVDAASFDAIARYDPTIGLFVEVVHLELPPAQVPIFLDYEQQRLLRDPSPAETLALVYHRSPAAVRQLVCRGRRKVRARIAQDARYEPLRLLPVLVA